MKLLNYILRKYIEGFKFTKSQKKINLLIYLDDIKMIINEVLQPNDDINSMNQEKDEDNSPILRIAKMQQFRDPRNMQNKKKDERKTNFSC